ncbi:phage tail assembly chaperone [Pseudomonas oryzihabitans]|uniref:phage tail assembly chaperone n=1 Tax=Pseudomonas oryzihabitans TaxID=47885 RepID=UPI0028946704|nr:phage tail assembly chaperone [Pseudomonas oryzihabitans]MDT3721406.1 phage tail assembly chaperone [Pseudomonas oryzihabitans]
MRYAHFDPISRAILGWLDTEAFSYPELPPQEQLIEVSDTDWDLRTGDCWYLDTGDLVTQAPAVDPLLELQGQMRVWRDNQLTVTDRLVNRHRDEVDLGGDKTLSPESYQELLIYRDALRNWPATPGFPQADQPAPPVWLYR